MGTGGSVVVSFGVSPCFRFYLYVFRQSWGGSKGKPYFQQDSARWMDCSYAPQYCLVKSEMVGYVVSFWWASVSQTNKLVLKVVEVVSWVV